jgi:hypothetical protein
MCYCASIDHVSVMEVSREFVHFDLWRLKATLKFVYHLLVLTILLCCSTRIKSEPTGILLTILCLSFSSNASLISYMYGSTYH